MDYVDLTSTLTIEEALQRLGGSYRSIDIRVLTRKSDGEWQNIITVVRFSHDTKNQVGKMHARLRERFGSLLDDNGGVLLCTTDFADWADIAEGLASGHIDLADHSVNLNTKTEGFSSSLCSNSLETIEAFCTDPFPRISCSVRFDSQKEVYIGRSRFGRVALNASELAKSCLGFERNKSYGMVLELPIYARISEKVFEEPETTMFKLISHTSLEHEIGFAVLQKTYPHDRRESVRKAKTFNTSDFSWIKDEEFVGAQIRFVIEKHEFMRSDLLEARLFTDFGIVDSEELYLREYLPIPSTLEGDSPNALKALSLCDGWKRVEEMLGLTTRDSPFARNKVDAFLIGVSWLLEIIGLRVFQLEFMRADFTLGLITAEEEKNDRFEIGDVDILAYDDENERFFAIDCTLNPPDSKKADLIANCAEKIEDRCGVRCEPMIIVSSRAADAKGNLKAASILDKDDLSVILDLIFEGKIEEAWTLFNNSLGTYNITNLVI